MKNIKIFSLLLFSTALIFNACRKEDNPNLPKLEKFTWLPLFVKDAASDNSISGQNPQSFKGKFVLNKYFESDENPQQVDIVVVKNGNKANVKIIKPGITSFPATVEITGTQLTTLFGAPIVLGDNFEIGADITTATGKKYEAFPITGNSYASGITAQPGASPTLVYIAACVFSNASFNGNYTIVEDTWQDFALGEKVEVKPGAGENQIAVTAYPSPAFGKNRKPMIVTVNPATFAATVPEQVIGDYDGAQPGSTVRGTGLVNPCGDDLTFTLKIKLDGVDYDATLKLQK